MIAQMLIAGVFMVGVSTAVIVAYLRAQKAARAYSAHFITVLPGIPQEAPDSLGFHYRVWDQREVPELNRVRAALLLAVKALDGVWLPVDINASLNGIDIIVKAEDAWLDGFGRRVGGLSLPGDTIAVGANLSALAHELAHLLERKLDHLEDAEHARWDIGGITKADAAYRKALATMAKQELT
ncbi:MAG: hypothetical protein Q7R39_02450 [Dehalococcoidia bacterium]|nr:hypothetical protein [Dehalococcoidia bacterium]